MALTHTTAIRHIDSKQTQDESFQGHQISLVQTSSAEDGGGVAAEKKRKVDDVEKDHVTVSQCDGGLRNSLLFPSCQHMHRCIPKPYL